MKGKLYLVATPIGNLNEFSPRAISILQEVDYIACEDTRTSRPLLTHFSIHTPTLAYHNFNEEESAKGLLKFLLSGKSIAIISDAGYPLISDPGYFIVQEAIKQDIKIIPISGPNAALNALIGSGLDNLHFFYFGFLSSKDSEAGKQLIKLKTLPYTLLFYEAPHRLLRTLKLMLKIFGNRKAVIAREITKVHEEFRRGTISELLALGEARGEIVLVIEGANNDNKSLDISTLEEEVKQLTLEGLPLKEISKILALKYDISKNEIYKYYLKNKGSKK